MEERLEIISKLQKLIIAMMQLSEAWENINSETEQVLTKKYPFHKDFVELTYDVIEWLDDVKSKLI